ncbi:DUF2892 domain-containing protein [Chitinophagales bacterium]|nr:DUF2892 domain-containing protein [Chitinophagales bacterium]
MKKNMGKTDKLIRLFVVIGFALLSYFEVVSGVLSSVLLGVAGVFLLTSFLNFCPLYALIGVNTCSVEEQSKE